MRQTPIPSLTPVLRPSRDLCGTTPEQFAALCRDLEPIWAAQRRVRLDRTAAADARPRQRRTPGAGAKPLPFAIRLLVALTHLRLGIPQRATAAILGVSQATVTRCVDELADALLVRGFQPPGATRAIRTTDDLAAYLRQPLPDLPDLPDLPADHDHDHDHRDPPLAPPAKVDATEIACPRPGDWDTQAPLYSGKRRDHTLKTTVVATGRYPAWVQGAVGGRTHDLALLTTQPDLLAALATAEIDLACDGGYRGLGERLPNTVQTPAKRPPGGRLGGATRRANQQLASVRVVVEHAIGAMKRWRILHYLRQRTGPERTIRAVGVLASLL